VRQVVDRRRRAGEIHDRVDVAVDVQRGGDVVLDETEALVRREILDVVPPAGDQVVDADDLMPVGEHAGAQVVAQEAAAAGDQYAHEAPRILV
jgi:hypothetical protein